VHWQETKFIAKRAEQEREHVVKAANRLLPPRVKAGEGMAYNVVSNVPVDDSRLAALEAKSAASTLHRVRPMIEEYTKAMAEAEEDKCA